MTDGLCWCASESKCPHGISAKIPAIWDDMEKIIDDVLQQFDRKTIKRFLKRDLDGNAKSALPNNIKEAYKSEGLQAALDKIAIKKTDANLDPRTKQDRAKKQRPVSPGGGSGGNSNNVNNHKLSRTAPVNPTHLDVNRNDSRSRPDTVANDSPSEMSTLPSNNILNRPKSQPRLGGADTNGFSRDLMSSSLPKIPTRVTSASLAAAKSERPSSPAAGIQQQSASNSILPSTSNSKAGGNSRVTTAWGGTDSPGPASSVMHTGPHSANLDSIEAVKQAMTRGSSPQMPMDLPGETTIGVGLMRIADNLTRRVLPWQAALCPRAVETLHDVRSTMIQAKHNAFIAQMKSKLEEKVLGFMARKEEEVDIWMEREIRSWQQFMLNGETDLTDFVKRDLGRITDRAVAQDQAYRTRELLIASQIDDHERDSTREQLVNFRRIVRSDSKGGAGAGKYASIEVRALQDSIAKAQSVTHKKVAKSNRDVTKRIEECHDWLCSLADNAITAAESEELLKAQYQRLDGEKVQALESLHGALGVYKEQHNAILEAIVVFAGRIHQHASDYLQREQLVSRAFLQYLLSIVNGEIKTHTSDQKKSNFAWETKSISDRGHRKESALVAEFHAHVSPLDKMVSDFKDRMRVQLDHITLKLQSVLNGRENDVNARKAVIHKKLAKHVNKACNARRQRLKDATAVRRDEFELEEKCITAVGELCGDLRSAIDQVWVKEHLKERRMYEASAGRMERLEKSALIIWNKHSHLAIGQKEQYEDWLEMSRRDRDLKMSEHLTAIEKSWRQWRAGFGSDLKRLGIDVRRPMRDMIRGAFRYDVSVPVEENVRWLSVQSSSILEVTLSTIDRLRGVLQTYISGELTEMDKFAQARKAALLEEWRDNLYLLNSAVNRRVGGLKDMEADLEETVRLTVLQHEVENAVFEQTSCAKMESFWLEWRSKMFGLSKTLRENQEDYVISKQSGAVKSRASKKDRALDDLVALSKERTTGGGGVTAGNSITLPAIVGSPHGRTAPKTLLLADENATTPMTKADRDDGVEAQMGDFVEVNGGGASDTLRLKRLLDEIRPELYRDFAHKTTRGLERVRRDLGEGKRRLVPAYSVARALMLSCDAFWEKAKLSERCVGRISSRGALLFREGLPAHARALFCVACGMYAISVLSPLREGGCLVDCDDVFELLESVKQVFMVGLLTVSLQLGEFGEYCLRSESLWACSALGVEPPKELVQFSAAKGIDRGAVDEMQPSGFYSEDPVDLLNALIALPVDGDEVKVLQRRYQEQLDNKAAAQVEAALQRAQQNDNSSVNDDASALDDNMYGHPVHLKPSGRGGSVGSSSLQHMLDGAEGSVLTEGEGEVFGYRNTAGSLFGDLETRVPMRKMVSKMSFLLPAADVGVFVAMLGRPEGSVEMTPHRLCQVVALWRRTALAVVTAAFDPPSSEYPRINDLVVAHSAAMSGKKRMGSGGNISCVSPFETISAAINWISSIKGVPLSVNQALCLLSRGGSVDPWLEDPRQTGRSGRILYELTELLDLFSCDIPRSMVHDEFMQVAFQPDLLDCLKRLDLNHTGLVPVEILRNYIRSEEADLTNTQISIVFWSLCRVDDDGATGDGEGSLEGGGGSTKTFQTGGVVYKPVVATEFNADPDQYMDRFGADVTRYLESMPTIDTNVIMGCLSTVLVPASAHELVGDAMKLDISARNAMPTTCCVWLGQRVVHSSDAIAALTVRGMQSKAGGMLVGVGEKSFGSMGSSNRFLADLRAHVEIDLLTKYPEMCDIRASDRHYGPAGNNPIASSQSGDNGGADHWQELTARRLGRMDRLTISWRDTMLNEWSTSLYQSRQQRYMHRVKVVKQCVGVYHQQYASLKDSIVAEREGLMSRFRSIESELLALIQEDYNFFAFHSSFVERALRRYEGQFERTVALLTDILSQYQRHCGSIKRRGISRVNAASDKLREELEMSCTGMILGYTAGYAQGYFDELIARGEQWRSSLTQVQGRLIVEKEAFMTAKDEIDRDVTIQVTDRITLDRNRTKGFVESLSDDTSKILETVATTRASYASLQKDANARLILRIEKAVRESRKLRVAAEQQAELEGPAMRDIRQILETARYSCLDIVEQIKTTCLKQLAAVQPLRPPHLEKMQSKVRALEAGWRDLHAILQPLVADYEREVFKQLSLSRSRCMEIANVYGEMETKALKAQHKRERKGLIESFRKHFREYDLSEAAIFERFNVEVNDTVKEMLKLWGPSRPRFITQGLAELESIVEDSLVSASNDVVCCMASGGNGGVNDDTSMSRMEIADVFTHSLRICYGYAAEIPQQFVAEKKSQLAEIADLSLTRNGDMVRPQVKAVLDLLVSGIEIDADFAKGYDALVTSTAVKTRECSTDLTEFVDRYSDPLKPLSIGYSASLTRGRINRRKEEVDSLLDAARAHIVADSSRLDVLLNAGEKDVEEWTSLTLQLVETAFHNAEQSYLSNLWPTPPTTPRLELVPEDEDRVGKLKALLKLSNAETSAMGALTVPNYADMDDEEQAAAEKRAKKEQRRREKENRRLAANIPAEVDRNVMPAHVKPDETRELQQGWFECCSPDGFVYYFNPATDESLWELPSALKVPLHSDDLDSAAGDRVLETPREFIMDGQVNAAPQTASLMRVVPAEYQLEVVVDPMVVMSQVAEEARAAASFALDTALDVTAVIRGKKGRGEQTIAALLGNKLNPQYLMGLRSEDNVSLGRDRDEDERSVDSAAQINKFGRLISDSSSQVDSDAAELLLEYGLGGGSEKDMAVSLPIIDEELRDAAGQMSHQEKNRWMALGLGDGSTAGDLEGNSSEEEDHRTAGESRRELTRKLAEEKFSIGRELGLMAAEEEHSIAVENLVEDTNCKKFMASLTGILQANAASDFEKQCLLVLAAVIKPINVVTILDGLHTSWARLDAIILETTARDRARQVQEEQLRTAEGQRRAATILEHAEDIEELADWLHGSAGLSITIAKRVATEALLRQISTPKKLAKIWQRGHVTLEEFGLDSDDTEDLAAALRQLLLASGGSTVGNNAASFSSNYQQQQLPVNINSAYSPFNSMSLPAQSFYLDPALVTEVEDYQDDAEEDAGRSHSQQQSPPNPGHNSSFAPNSSALSSSSGLRKKYSLSAEGYKSFRGGWIEGTSDANHKYYYNTATGASAWVLPEEGYSAAEDHEFPHEDVEDEGAAAMAPHNPTVQHPTNTFGHTYGDEYGNDQYAYPEDPSGYHGNQSDQQYDEHHYYDHSQQQYVEGHEGHYDQQYHDPSSGHEYPASYYDEHGQLQYYSADAAHQGYYDHNGAYYAEGSEHQDHYYDYAHQQHEHSAGQTSSLEDFVSPPKPRTLPVPVRVEVAAYAKKEGVLRQLELLNAQDRWQNSLVKSQHYITEQKSLYLDKRAEMFAKVSTRVDARLEAFVEDIKYMQKSVKRELGESNSTERDLRRLFEESHGQHVIQAEKLSFVLESLEKFKHTLNNRYESAFKQIDKFSTYGDLFRSELVQFGDIYDEGVAANLDQCRLACEHNAKVFAYDQLKAAAALKRQEIKLLRRSVHQALMADTHDEEEARARVREEQLQYHYQREYKREEVRRAMGGVGWSKTIEAEVVAAGLPPVAVDTEVAPEEEVCMSFMLTALEMEASLAGDYDSIVEASKSLALELQAGVADFDAVEKKNLRDEGSWFNKHRETVERHEAALNSTLTKVRNRVNDGYKVLQAKVDALDFDVERAAEEELFRGEHEQDD